MYWTSSLTTNFDTNIQVLRTKLLWQVNTLCELNRIRFTSVLLFYGKLSSSFTPKLFLTHKNKIRAAYILAD